MQKEKVVIIGTGGHAKVVVDIIEQQNMYEIAGFITNDELDKFCGYKVLGDDNYLDELKKRGINNLAIGIGGFTNNELRKKIFLNLEKQGFNIVNCIHSKATIAGSVKLGRGVVIFAGVVVNPFVTIEDNCIIATSSSIDHDTIIRSHCLISAGVTIGANVVMEESGLCALGSKVISQVMIGENVLIAAGAVVTKNILPNETVFGIPAKSKK